MPLPEAAACDTSWGPSERTIYSTFRAVDELVGCRRLHSPTFSGSGAVVWYRRDIGNREYVETRRLQGPDGRFTTWSGAFHKNVNGLHTMVHGTSSGTFSTHLGSVRCTLARAFEPSRTSTAPRDRTARHVGDRYQRVIERGVNVSVSAGNDFSFSPTTSLRPLWCSSSHISLCLLDSALLALRDHSHAG
jgi:hypothetical protein